MNILVLSKYNNYKKQINGDDLMWNVFPGDKRMVYLSQMLKNIENDKLVEILPIPVTRDKIYICDSNVKITDFFKKIDENSLIFCGKKFLLPENIIKKYKIYDYSDNETFLLKNAELTAYGTIKILNEKSDKPIKNLKILISGFGRIGKILSKLLVESKTNVHVLGHSEKDYFWINNFDATNFDYSDNKFDFIINTVPKIIFNEENLKKINSKNFIELASKPGVDKKICKKLNINYISALGIPGKFYPLQAAKIIKESILKILKGEL